MSIKIIAFIDWYKPGYKGGGITTSFVNFVDHLKDYFEFYIVTRNTDYTDNEPYQNIPCNQWVEINKNEHVFYCSQDYITRKNICELVNTFKYDYIYINGIYSFWFSLVPAFHVRSLKNKVLINPHGMLSDHGVAVKSLKKKAYLSAANLFKVYKNIAFHVTDDLEAIAVKKRIKSLSEVKIAWQFPRKLITKDNHNVSKQKDELLLISIARIAPEKNILFALQCLHQLDVIKNKNLKVVFNLYGTVYSSDYWEQCQNVINNLPDNIKVYYHGALDSTRVMEVIGEHHFLFMPSCGENFGHTILESLSAGCPVIISDKTPWRNLEKVGSGEWAVNNEQFKVNNPTANSQQPTAVGIGWDLPLDEPQRFVEVIEYCAAMGQEEYNTMSQRAFKYAQTIINDPKVLEVNRKLFE